MAKKKGADVEILVESAIWRSQRGLDAALKKAVKEVIAHLPLPYAQLAGRAQWTLLLTTDQAVHRLNATYRQVDKPTNVLSFPQFSPETLRRIVRQKVFNSPQADIYMGDIAIASRYVVREAKREGKDLQDHVVHLFIHGLLHLFGYDHLTEKEAIKMERLETTIMRALGRSDPYEEVGESQKEKKISKKRRV